MALTVTLSGDWMESIGSRRAVNATIAFDSSYPTGGESLTAANLGLGVLDKVEIESKSGYTFSYDYTNSKVLAYVSGAVAAHTHDLKIIGGQAAAGTAATAYYATDIFGKEAATNATIVGADSATKGGVVSGAAVSAGALAEVADTTNLSTLTGVRVRAYGR